MITSLHFKQTCVHSFIFWINSHSRFILKTNELIHSIQFISKMNWFIIHNSSKNESINYQFSFNSFFMIFVMGKVVALWNKTMRPKSSEIIVQGFGRSIERPCPTRWNSEYDCMLWPNLQSSRWSLTSQVNQTWTYLSSCSNRQMSKWISCFLRLRYTNTSQSSKGYNVTFEILKNCFF